MSATSRILTKCEVYIVAEEETTGQSSIWEYIYRLMRCDIRLCPHKSDWCWENLKNKKYYKFRNPHLERLIDYVDKDSILDSYNNILGNICWNLVLESQAERKSKKTGASTPELLYYRTIINILSGKDSSASAVILFPPWTLAGKPLIIAGPRKLAVKKYCK